MNRLIYKTDNKKYRILEIETSDFTLDDLKGDTYNPEVNAEIAPEQLKREELEFEELVNREGVFGYVLEKWNAQPGHGYEHVDSCWGFVGQYSDSDKSGVFNHYIVEELKSQIPGRVS